MYYFMNYIVRHFLLQNFMATHQLPWLSINAKKNAPKFYPSFISGALRDLFSRRRLARSRYCDMKRLKLFWICFAGANGSIRFKYCVTWKSDFFLLRYLCTVCSLHNIIIKILFKMAGISHFIEPKNGLNSIDDLV